MKNVQLQGRRYEKKTKKNPYYFSYQTVQNNSKSTLRWIIYKSWNINSYPLSQELLARYWEIRPLPLNAWLKKAHCQDIKMHLSRCPPQLYLKYRNICETEI